MRFSLFIPFQLLFHFHLYVCPQGQNLPSPISLSLLFFFLFFVGARVWGQVSRNPHSICLSARNWVSVTEWIKCQSARIGAQSLDFHPIQSPFSSLPYHRKSPTPPQVTVFLSLVALTFRLTVNFFRLSWPFRVFSFRFCLLSVCKFVLFHSDMRNDKKKIRTQKRWQLGLADAIYQLMEGSFLNCWISKEKYKKPFHTYTSLETGLPFAHLINHATI